MSYDDDDGEDLPRWWQVVAEGATLTRLDRTTDAVFTNPDGTVWHVDLWTDAAKQVTP